MMPPHYRLHLFRLSHTLVYAAVTGTVARLRPGDLYLLHKMDSAEWDAIVLLVCKKYAISVSYESPLPDLEWELAE